MVVLAGRPLVEHVYLRLQPQVGRGWVSLRPGMPWHGLPWPAVEDARRTPSGPLAGVAAGLRVARAAALEFLLVVPCDAPQLPHDLGLRLHRAMLGGQAPAAVARAGGRMQPTFALLRTALADSAAASLARAEGALWRWLEHSGAATAEFGDVAAELVNINTPVQLRALEQMLAGEKR